MLIDDDRRQPPLERLAQHEPRLRQRTLRRVHQQHHAVHHRQRPLDLAAEIGVARRVDDVDQDVLVVDGRVLGQDRDAALALEVVVVHGALGDALVRAEGAALMQQRIDERGLAVVDVRDDGDVPAKRIRDVDARSWTRTLFSDRSILQCSSRIRRHRPGQSSSWPITTLGSWLASARALTACWTSADGRLQNRGHALFEYACRACGHHFEYLTRDGQTPSCPSCASAELEKQLSVFAVSANGRSSLLVRTARPAACGMCGDPRGPGACSIN